MEKKLIELNFETSGHGIHYLAEAIRIKKENKFIGYCEIYNRVAKKYNETSSRVERCIRHCVSVSKNEYRGNTNGQVISTLAILL